MSYDVLTPAKVKGIIMQSKWNALSVSKTTDKIIIKGLYPFKGRGKSIYFPFIVGVYKLEVDLLDN